MDLSLESLKIRAVVLRIFDYVGRSDMIAKNPAKRAHLPRLTEDNRERAQLTDAEFRIYVTWP